MHLSEAIHICWKLPQDHLNKSCRADSESQHQKDLQNNESFLDKRGRKVLSMRFGLTKEKESMKLDDIAETLNVSGERVRQLESLGLRKLRAVVVSVLNSSLILSHVIEEDHAEGSCQQSHN